ncbi:NAD-dependent epimerase/dehydratase family protein [Streptomyces sp. NPDC001980]|uniref:NAD-dependent epimerase/dehydratase family protein n=1 Tax=Streptomyces sp. NPDC001980 TaxID=3157126 RepID=UPI00331EBF4F
MRVFVTGATGFVGSAVVRELLDAGHRVLGLARSDSAAATLTSVGAEVHRGDLDDLDRAAGFIPLMISIARRTGVSAYVGDRSPRWAAVHQRDTARLFRLAVESAPAGARLHAIGDEGVSVRDIAQAIGRRLNLPATGMPQDEADGHFGFLGAILARDSPASSTRTQQRLGWQPVRPGLIADIEDGHYFTVR